MCVYSFFQQYNSILSGKHCQVFLHFSAASDNSTRHDYLQYIDIYIGAVIAGLIGIGLATG